MNDQVTMTKANEHDLELLFQICRQSYSETFAHHWNVGGLDWYLDEVYGLDAIASDRYFVMDDGFLK